MILLQFLIRTAKWLLQNSLHSSDLTPKRFDSNLLFASYKLLSLSYPPRWPPLLPVQEVWTLSSNTHSTTFSSHLKLIPESFVEIYTLKCLVFEIQCFWLIQTIHYWKIRVTLLSTGTLIVVHWSQQPAYYICWTSGSILPSEHSLWWVHFIPLFCDGYLDSSPFLDIFAILK